VRGGGLPVLWKGSEVMKDDFIKGRQAELEENVRALRARGLIVIIFVTLGMALCLYAGLFVGMKVF
jgi:hypothetical protein